MSDSDAEKKRNKLGYQRTSIACSHCRRRKIRCLREEGDTGNRCHNCIRLKKECVYQAVGDQKAKEAGNPPGHSDISEPSSAVSQSPSLLGQPQGFMRSKQQHHGFNQLASTPGSGFQGIPIMPISLPGQGGEYAYTSPAEIVQWSAAQNHPHSGHAEISGYEPSDSRYPSSARYENAAGIGYAAFGESTEQHSPHAMTSNEAFTGSVHPEASKWPYFNQNSSRVFQQPEIHPNTSFPLQNTAQAPYAYPRPQYGPLDASYPASLTSRSDQLTQYTPTSSSSVNSPGSYALSPHQRNGQTTVPAPSLSPPHHTWSYAPTAYSGMGEPRILPVTSDSDAARHVPSRSPG